MDHLLRLPPGFRFHPTDEELLLQYLNRKAHSRPLPAAFIPDLDVCKSNPWDLPGDTKQERYFFSTREIKHRANRATGSGYWKATGPDKRIPTSDKQIHGMKKTLVFYQSKTRTDWIMHEYRLDPTIRSLKENWVLCRVFLKKRKGKRNNKSPVLYDFMGKKDHLSNSSDASSGITATGEDPEISSAVSSFTATFS